MSQYKKPKRITFTLWIMLIGLILAVFAGVIVPYLPTGNDDIAEMTQGINAATDTTIETRPVGAPDAATFDDTLSDTPDEGIMQPNFDSDDLINNPVSDG